VGRRQCGSYSSPQRHASQVEGRPYAIIPAKAIEGENRWKLFGKTASGRYLVVVFTVRRRLFRAVTAYEMNATDRRNYAPQID